MKRFIWAVNPFYLLSALCVVAGLRSLFPTIESANYAWILVASVASYISLLAVTVIVIVRFGGVWDDARSILLLIVFLLASLSLGFDELLLSSFGEALAPLAAAAGFVVVVCEGLLMALRLRFPWRYRLPFYSLLAVTYATPVVLAQVAQSGEAASVEYGVLASSVAVAVALLTALPSVRGAAISLGDRGSPWRWPWYPWAALVVVSVAAMARILIVRYAFGARDLGLLPLVLPLLAWSVLLTEVGFRGRSLGQRAAGVCGVLLPLVTVSLVLIELAGGVHVQAPSWSIASVGIAAPFLSLLATSAVLLHALWRRSSGAEHALVAVISVTAFVGLETRGMDSLVLHGWWLTALGAVVLVRALRFSDSLRHFAGASLLLLGISIECRDAGFLVYSAIIPTHAGLAITITLGWLFQDPLGRCLRRLSVLGIVFLALSAVLQSWIPAEDRIPIWLALLDSANLAVVAYMMSCLTLKRSYFWLGTALAVLTLSNALAHWLDRGKSLSSGEIALAAGLGFFIAGVLTSAHKAGWWQLPPQTRGHAAGPQDSTPSSGGCSAPLEETSSG